MTAPGYFKDGHPKNDIVRPKVDQWFKNTFPGTVDLSGGQSAKAVADSDPDSRRKVDDHINAGKGLRPAATGAAGDTIQGSVQGDLIGGSGADDLSGGRETDLGIPEGPDVFDEAGSSLGEGATDGHRSAPTDPDQGPETGPSLLDILPPSPARGSPEGARERRRAYDSMAEMLTRNGQVPLQAQKDLLEAARGKDPDRAAQARDMLSSLHAKSSESLQALDPELRDYYNKTVQGPARAYNHLVPQQPPKNHTEALARGAARHQQGREAMAKRYIPEALVQGPLEGVAKVGDLASLMSDGKLGKDTAQSLRDTAQNMAPIPMDLHDTATVNAGRKIGEVGVDLALTKGAATLGKQGLKSVARTVTGGLAATGAAKVGADAAKQAERRGGNPMDQKRAAVLASLTASLTGTVGKDTAKELAQWAGRTFPDQLGSKALQEGLVALSEQLAQGLIVDGASRQPPSHDPR
ncbi:hypothetical protein [Magnetospira sp. QH-2]|uniref:hypothetical protein n=1 Tax=Magnetospira sp. (strain QH-2) TaxID=1288970 RepID=UPI0005FA78D8|nr:hypothetical protein [Magnetospira sp. QH-2]